MPGRDEAKEPLRAAYLDAGERMSRSREDAVRRTQEAMKATAGWQAAAKAAAAQSVLEATRSECEALVSELVDAHLNAGERDPTRVAARVNAGFLSGLTAPGLAFFPTSGPEAAALAIVATRHAADFESDRDRLATTVAERFQAALESRKQDIIPEIEPLTWAERLRRNRLLFVFLVVSTVLSIAGISWVDVLRGASGFL
jgi:hypothetical protein